MQRPAVFHNPHIAIDNIPYQFATETSPGLPEGGVLRSGRTVWTRDSFGRPTSKHMAEAFIEEIGTVVVDTRWLKRADAVQRH